MTSSTKLDEKLEGTNNFRAWKHRIMLVLEEHDLDRLVEGEVTKPEDEVTRAKVQKKRDLIRAKEVMKLAVAF